MIDNARDFFVYPPARTEPINMVEGKTALVVVDLQHNQATADAGMLRALEVLDPGSAAYLIRRLDETTLPAVVRLLRLWRSRGWPVIHVCYGSDDAELRDFPPRMRRSIKEMERVSGVADIFWTNNPWFSFREEVAPEPGEVVLRKTTFSAFNSTDIEQRLRDLGVETVVLAGITTNCCVETAGRDASERGFGVVIVEEATADFDAAAQAEVARTFSFNFGAVIPSVDALRGCIDHGSTEWMNSPPDDDAGTHEGRDQVPGEGLGEGLGEGRGGR